MPDVDNRRAMLDTLITDYEAITRSCRRLWLASMSLILIVLVQSVFLVWLYHRNPTQMTAMPDQVRDSFANLTVKKLTVGSIQAQSLDCPKITATTVAVDDLTTKQATIHNCQADSATINNLSGKVTFADYLSVRSEITVGDTPPDAILISQEGITLQGKDDSRLTLQAQPTRSLSLHDEVGRLRLVIGQAALTKIGVGDETLTAESSITAFDQDGKVLMHPITTTLRR